MQTSYEVNRLRVGGLIGYFENICSDRALERQINIRFDLRFFNDTDIAEPIPDHSSFCRIRKRIPLEIFEDVFNHILKLCIQKGLVDGKIQSIDSAYINANASLDRLVEVKMIVRDPKDYLDEVMEQDVHKNVYRHDDEKLAKKRMEKSQKSLERYRKYRENKYKRH